MVLKSIYELNYSFAQTRSDISKFCSRFLSTLDVINFLRFQLRNAEWQNHQVSSLWRRAIALALIA